MNIFIDIKTDKSVQVGDKIRFDFSKSFVPKPNSTATDIVYIEVDPTGSGESLTPIHDATAEQAPKLSIKEWYFDWVYTSLDNAVDGEQSFYVSFNASDDTSANATVTFSLLTSAQDNLFSDDNDLIAHEPDILKWLPDGRSSWIYVHRRAQERILSTLFEKGYKNTDGTPFTKDQILEKYDVKEWSTFMALKIIFGSIINSKDDVFLQKAKFYENLESRASETSIRVDINADGTQSSTELARMGEVRLVRR